MCIRDRIKVLKKTKKNEREINIRPLIYEMNVSEEHIQMLLAAGSEENLKPDLVMQAFLKYAGMDIEETPFHYHRIDVYAKDDNGFVPLENLGRIID